MFWLVLVWHFLSLYLFSWLGVTNIIIIYFGFYKCGFVHGVLFYYLALLILVFTFFAWGLDYRSLDVPWRVGYEFTVFICWSMIGF